MPSCAIHRKWWGGTRGAGHSVSSQPCGHQKPGGVEPGARHTAGWRGRMQPWHRPRVLRLSLGQEGPSLSWAQRRCAQRCPVHLKERLSLQGWRHLGARRGPHCTGGGCGLRCRPCCAHSRRPPRLNHPIPASLRARGARRGWLGGSQKFTACRRSSSSEPTPGRRRGRG